MKRVCMLFVLLSALSTAAHAQIKMVHEFAGGADDGANPMLSQLLQSGSTLYGMTGSGGDNDAGVIFKINTDGNGFRVLHGFSGGADDGAMPFGSISLSDLTLYGMTSAGGDSDWGVVFSFPLLSPPVPALTVPGMIIFAVLLLGVTLRFISRKGRHA
jgi:uncharacterized repeat protein (TIGR03803 family)